MFKNDNKYRLLILIMICMFCLNTANLIVAVDKMMVLGATAKGNSVISFQLQD